MGANCATAAAARPKYLGQAQRIRLGPRVPDCAESVGTAMTKTIIREIQLEKLLIRCLFSESWRVIRKNLIWDGKKRFFFMGIERGRNVIHRKYPAAQNILVISD